MRKKQASRNRQHQNKNVWVSKELKHACIFRSGRVKTEHVTWKVNFYNSIKDSLMTELFAVTRGFWTMTFCTAINIIRNKLDEMIYFRRYYSQVDLFPIKSELVNQICMGFCWRSQLATRNSQQEIGVVFPANSIGTFLTTLTRPNIPAAIKQKLEETIKSRKYLVIKEHIVLYTITLLQYYWNKIPQNIKIWRLSLYLKFECLHGTKPCHVTIFSRKSVFVSILTSFNSC